MPSSPSHIPRRYGWRAAVAALIVAFSTACASAGSVQPSGRGSAAFVIDSVIASAPLDQVQWGVLAVEARSGRTVYSHQPRTKLIPASNMKALVGAATLDRLGADYRFETALWAAGSFDPASGTLQGDLVLPGSGDPTLSSRYHGARGALRALIDSLRAFGVREVTGSLVIDASAWDSATAVASWMVEDLPDAATGGAFVLEEGVTTVIVEAAALPGEPARVTWSPRGEDGFIVSRIRTVETPAEVTPIRATYEPESRRLVLDGRLLLRSSDTLRLGTRDPVRQAGAALARALTDSGIRLDQGWRVAWVADEPLAAGCTTGSIERCGARRVAGLASPKLLEVVGVTLGASHNWMAEQLVRSLGRADTTAAGMRALASWSTGLAALRRYLVDSGVDTLDLRLRDGSGLSAQNVVTPRAMVQVLQRVSAESWGDGFRSALAEPAEASSTLSARLRGLEGRVFAKTGTLTNVAALSGYVLRADGEVVVFSILTNASGLGASRVQTGIDEIVRALARE